MNKTILILAALLTVLNIDAQTPENLQAVDLGLPSGTLWANMNIGASSFEEYGQKFAWAETETKDVHTLDNYEYRVYHEPEVGEDGWEIQAGYFEYLIQILNISDTEYDAAKAQWGDGWIMPTAEDVQELRDNCECIMTRYLDIVGLKITGKNGNFIFLPAAGVSSGNGYNYYEGTGVAYWTATRVAYLEDEAVPFDDFDDPHFGFINEVWVGRSVRPIKRTNYIEKETALPPTISITNGELIIESPTENSVCNYTITCLDSRSGVLEKKSVIPMSGQYSISAFAAAEGYLNSETVYATLVWVNPVVDNSTNILTMEARKAVVIKSESGQVVICGTEQGEQIALYDVSGKEICSVKAVEGETILPCKLQYGTIVILKYGDQAIKIKI